MDNFVPDIYKQSIYDINYKDLKKRGITCLLFDLDNTLVPYNVDIPTKQVEELFNTLVNKDFKVIIISNSNKKRLTPFKDKLNVDVAYSSYKPFKKKYKKIQKIYNLKATQIAAIGDQLITDIFGANRMGFTSILVNSISPNETLPTKINRFFEKFILKNFKKKEILIKGKYYD